MPIKIMLPGIHVLFPMLGILELVPSFAYHVTLCIEYLDEERVLENSIPSTLHV